MYQWSHNTSCISWYFLFCYLSKYTSSYSNMFELMSIQAPRDWRGREVWRLCLSGETQPNSRIDREKLNLICPLDKRFKRAEYKSWSNSTTCGSYQGFWLKHLAVQLHRSLPTIYLRQDYYCRESGNSLSESWYNDQTITSRCLSDAPQADHRVVIVCEGVWRPNKSWLDSLQSRCVYRSSLLGRIQTFEFSHSFLTTFLAISIFDKFHINFYM